MKKIFFILISVISIISTSCNYNEDNFPGYDSGTAPTNVVNYEYTLTTADYKTISTAALKLATNTPDSAKATSIDKNKYFNNEVIASNYVPLLLATKYPYADNNSVVFVTYNYNSPYDTTKIATANKYTLVTTDYDAMGTGANQPGQYDNFSAVISTDFYIPIWLKLKYPYAKSGDIQLIRYKYYASSVTSNDYAVFIHNGINWVKYNNTNPETGKYKLKEKVWTFIDSDILMGLQTAFGDFKAISVIGDQGWSWDAYGYAKMTGYVSGAYYDNEDWLVSPAMDFTERVTPWVSFSHTGRYFGDTGTSTEKMRKAVTIWISTTSDGNTIKESDWTQLTIPDAGYPSGTNWTFVSSTPISLAAYAGKSNVRIALKYLSSSADNAAGTWEVKNVYVFEE